MHRFHTEPPEKSSGRAEMEGDHGHLEAQSSVCDVSCMEEQQDERKKNSLAMSWFKANVLGGNLSCRRLDKVVAKWAEE